MKLATIERIHSVRPHPNADALEVAKIKAWPVVIKKGEYKDGDLVVFIVIDSIVPESNPYFKFLEGRKYRVWNAKFRGAPSQGLVCPSFVYTQTLSAVKMDDDGTYNSQIHEGLDVTEDLGVTKYEKPIDASIAGDTAGNFPTNLIPVTDEDNLLNNPNVLHELYGRQCYLTVKADGSSCTIIHQDGVVRVCSRRLEQKEGSGFWKIAETLFLPENLKKYGKNIAIQAEACGGKIQGNKMDFLAPDLLVFNIRDLDTGKWLGWHEIITVCSILGLQTVQVIWNRENFTFDETWTIDRLQAIANDVAYIQRNGQKKPGEGIVLRPMEPAFSEVLNGNLSVKILNVNYKQ